MKTCSQFTHSFLKDENIRINSKMDGLVPVCSAPKMPAVMSWCWLYKIGLVKIFTTLVARFRGVKRMLWAIAQLTKPGM